MTWEEWKTEAGLERLAQTMPNRYRRDEFGHWTCPPGKRFAEQFGLYYRLRSSAEIDWALQRNLRFLADYLALDPASINQRSANVILELVKERPGVHLAALVAPSARMSSEIPIPSIWTGSEWIVWGGLSSTPLEALDDGARYFPPAINRGG